MGGRADAAGAAERARQEPVARGGAPRGQQHRASGDRAAAGIPTEKAKDIVKFLKDAKLKKVQASIQGDQLRVTSPSRDDLQEAMRLLREQDFGVALQFGNYRG